MNKGKYVCLGILRNGQFVLRIFGLLFKKYFPCGAKIREKEALAFLSFIPVIIGTLLTDIRKNRKKEKSDF